MSRDGGFPWLRWYPKDFAGDARVQLMPPLARLAYRGLLDLSWQVGPLSDPESALELLGVDRELWQHILPCWIEAQEGGWIQPRLEQERAEAARRSAKARRGAEGRWNAPRTREAMPTHSPSNASQSQSQSQSQKEKRPPTPPAEPAGEPCLDIPADIIEIFRFLGPCGAHNILLREASDQLTATGWRSRREASAPTHTCPGGRIDILAVNPEGMRIGIEIDRKTPKARSIAKLRSLPFAGLIVLRDGLTAPPPHGIGAVVGLADGGAPRRTGAGAASTNGARPGVLKPSGWLKILEGEFPDLAQAEVPDTIDDGGGPLPFAEVWSRYTAHRSENKARKLQPTSLRAKFRKAQEDPALWGTAIRYSVTQDYTGYHPSWIPSELAPHNLRGAARRSAVAEVLAELAAAGRIEGA